MSRGPGVRQRQIIEHIPPGRAIAVDDLLCLNGDPITKSMRDSVTKAARSLDYRGFTVRQFVTRAWLPKSPGGPAIEAMTGGISPESGTVEDATRTVPELVVPSHRRLADCPCCGTELFVAEPRGGYWTADPPKIRATYRRAG